MRPIHFVFVSFVTCNNLTSCSFDTNKDTQEIEHQLYADQKAAAIARKLNNMKFRQSMTELELATALGLSDPRGYEPGGRRGFQTPWNLGGGYYLIVFCDAIPQLRHGQEFGQPPKFVGVQLFRGQKLIAASSNRYRFDG